MSMGVPGGVPGGIFEVDDVHRRHASLDEWQMVVFDFGGTRELSSARRHAGTAPRHRLLHLRLRKVIQQVGIKPVD